MTTSATTVSTSTTQSRPSWLDAKTLLALFITLILVVGEVSYGVVGGFEKLALTLGTCVVVELALSRWLTGKSGSLQSAYISGISLVLLVRPQSGLVWPFVVGAALSIGSKFVLRYRDRHLFNPSNFGIAVLLLLAPSRVALLSHELGNDILVNGVIWIVGLLVVSRARVLHVTLAYVGSFLVLAAARSAITGAPLVAEIAPVTGPMYQLLALFMLTDPRTTVSRRGGRMLVVAIVALVEAAIRLGNDFDLAWASIFAPAPPILALFVVGPIALVIDLRRTRAAKLRDQGAPSA